MATTIPVIFAIPRGSLRMKNADIAAITGIRFKNAEALLGPIRFIPRLYR